MSKLKRKAKGDLRHKIAKNLRDARNEADPKRTQTEVGEKFDPPLSRSAIAQWEVGDTIPDLDRLAVLSKLYGKTIDALVFGDRYIEDATLSPETVKFAKVFQSLSMKDRNVLISMAQSLKAKKDSP